MKHNLKRILRLTEARTPWIQAVRAWRRLLPDWTPSLDALRELDTRPHEHITAVRIVADGWPANDPRWDVLMALLEWERREERKQHVTVLTEEAFEDAAREVFTDFKERLDEHFERVRADSETTVETPFLRACHWCDDADEEFCVLHDPAEPERPRLTLVPKPGVPKAFTVRTLASIRAEQQGEEQK